jgi:hypothetical protein
VVVTAGPWVRRLLAPAGIELPVVETRETVAYFRLDGPVPSVVAELVARGHGFYSLHDDRRRAGHRRPPRPDRGRLRLLGPRLQVAPVVGERLAALAVEALA